MSRHPRAWMGIGLCSLFGQAHAAWDLNMRSGATDVSRSVFDLHMTIFWICVIIGVLVFAVMFWSMFAHRRSKRLQSAQDRKSTRLNSSHMSESRMPSSA